MSNEITQSIGDKIAEVENTVLTQFGPYTREYAVLSGLVAIAELQVAALTASQALWAQHAENAKAEMDSLRNRVTVLEASTAPASETPAPTETPAVPANT